jgi:hypothetical protein
MTDLVFGIPAAPTGDESSCELRIGPVEVTSDSETLPNSPLNVFAYPSFKTNVLESSLKSLVSGYSEQIVQSTVGEERQKSNGGRQGRFGRAEDDPREHNTQL